MAKPTKEQIKEFWKGCGLYYTEPYWVEQNGVLAFYGETLSELRRSIDLNNLFKYAVPRLNLPDNELYCVEFTYNKPNGGITCDIKREIDLIQAHGETEALALFWALKEASK